MLIRCFISIKIKRYFGSGFATGALIVAPSPTFENSLRVNSGNFYRIRLFEFDRYDTALSVASLVSTLIPFDSIICPFIRLSVIL